MEFFATKRFPSEVTRLELHQKMSRLRVYKYPHLMLIVKGQGWDLRGNEPNLPKQRRPNLRVGFCARLNAMHRVDGKCSVQFGILLFFFFVLCAARFFFFG